MAVLPSAYSKMPKDKAEMSYCMVLTELALTHQEVHFMVIINCLQLF